MKTKKIFLTIILMTMIMILLSGGISQAALQANPNTHGKKTLALSSWISQIRQMEAADGAMGLAETIGSDLTGAESNGSNAPSNWYDYSASKWANIVIDTGTTQTYYTWIPRYQFMLDQENERSIVEFLPGTSTETKAGYQIPEAFTFNNQQLTGYWVSKYTVGE